ncbi:MAG: tRNA (N6-threonylcarbamoyladenosine(37)-N6)-methyltransferase TrmO [Thermoplasmata archaeon]|nr:tRNA (N6-threonylcarbamoyladenosine(37)-N6)-methyltransferase TrmO [Thermoplasmata archaeon]
MKKNIEINYKPIGIIHSLFVEAKGTPIQTTTSNAEGTVEIYPEYIVGLKDIDGFSHIILLYHFHLSGKPTMEVKPFLDDSTHGVFATRAPSRPNSIGISVVKLVRMKGNILHVKGLDILDGTPLLDIKPYVPEFDSREVEKIGWLEKRVRGLKSARDDGRFQ